MKLLGPEKELRGMQFPPFICLSFLLLKIFRIEAEKFKFADNGNLLISAGTTNQTDEHEKPF